MSEDVRADGGAWPGTLFADSSHRDCGERIFMLREELLDRIAKLPVGMEVGIRFGGELFGIEDVRQLPADDEVFGMLDCTPADVRSMLHDWGYTPRQIQLIMNGTWAGGVPAPESRNTPAADEPVDSVG